MILKIIRLSVLLIIFSPAFAAKAELYRFSRAVIQPQSETQTLSAVTLDDPIYNFGQEGFADLRLTDQDGVETPYLLQRIAARKTVSRRLSSPISTRSLQKSGDDGIVITIGLDKDAAFADGLTVVTPQHDFEYNLQILGSPDGKDWRQLVDNAAIYDYSRYMAVDQRDIVLPANRDRFLKIVIGKATQTSSSEMLELTRTLRGEAEQLRDEKSEIRHEPLHIERIEAWHLQAETEPEAAQTFDYPVKAFKISQDAEHQTSLIDIDGERQPLTGFKLQIETANYSRNAEVQIPLRHGVESRMQAIGHALLQALHFQGVNREQTSLSFPEQRREHYRIVIQNQDNPPLSIAAVSGVGIGYQLLFLPQPGKQYRLQYGADKILPAVYDTASIQELLSRGFQITQAKLAPEVVEAPIEKHLDMAAWLGSVWFLGIAISLMVLVLAWSLYRVGKRVGDLPEH